MSHEAPETDTCEGCGAVVAETELHSSLDGVSLCSQCWAEWEASRDRCTHRWRRSTEYFDFSRACDVCGWVEKISPEEFAALPEEDA